MVTCALLTQADGSAGVWTRDPITCTTALKQLSGSFQQWTRRCSRSFYPKDILRQQAKAALLARADGNDGSWTRDPITCTTALKQLSGAFEQWTRRCRRSFYPKGIFREQANACRTTCGKGTRRVQQFRVAMPGRSKAIDIEVDGAAKDLVADPSRIMRGCRDAHFSVLDHMFCLHKRDVSSRYLAAEALADLGSKAKKAVPTLQKVLSNDSSIYVRKSAALALGEIGDEISASCLRHAAEHDENEFVRERAQEALLQIFGMNAMV